MNAFILEVAHDKINSTIFFKYPHHTRSKVGTENIKMKKVFKGSLGILMINF